MPRRAPARNPRSTTANRPEPVPYDQPIFFVQHSDLGMTHFTTRDALSAYLGKQCDGPWSDYELGDFTVAKVQSGIVTDITIKTKGFTFSDEAEA